MAIDERGIVALLRAEGLRFNTRAEWGSQYESVYHYRKTREPYALGNNFPLNFLFVHISVTPEVGDSLGDEFEAMRIIERVGYDRFKSGFSYNFAAHDSGRLMMGQPLNAKGTHTVNDKNVSGMPYNLNMDAHAIVLPQMEDDEVTDVQVDSIARWGACLKRTGLNNVRGNRFYPHAHVAWKACPGAKMIARLDDANDLMNDYIRKGLPSSAMAVSEQDLKKIVANASYRAARKALRERVYQDRNNPKIKRSVVGMLAEIEKQTSGVDWQLLEDAAEDITNRE